MKTTQVFSKDLVAGLLFVALGTAFLWIGLDYRPGTVRQMGPGFFPISLAILLMTLGAIVAAKALIAGSEPIEGVNFKGIFFVIGATALFSLLIRPAGMLVSVVLLAGLGAFASSRFRLGPTILLAAGLAAFCIVVFNWGLGLPFPVFGYWFD